ncbi:putative cyclin d [Hibiscus syriacus]|uniref:Cyclin d n=1 Tax=Hibiscus syriacus TaxID=106335 RepID=A0A6A3CXD1_HIBSY|nr:putative cyclin d [Hibiscus syriacus]
MLDDEAEEEYLFKIVIIGPFIPFKCTCWDIQGKRSMRSMVFNNFLHNEYGGPGTLLVEPFMDMFVALKEKQLPGAPVAARASLLWAQIYVDHDWRFWHSNSPK